MYERGEQISSFTLNPGAKPMVGRWAVIVGTSGSM